MKYNFDKLIDRTHTSCVKYDLRQTVFEKSDVIPMWVADMDFETPDFIRNAVIQRAGHPVYGYTFRDEDYYQAVMEWMQSHHDWAIDKEDFIFTPGVVPALNFAVMAFTKPGDHIIVQPPVYPPIIHAVPDHNRKLSINQLIRDENTYLIDFVLLEQQAKEAEMLILCNPHNPVGRCWNRQELEKILKICLEHHVLVFSDEIHADLVMPGFRHQVFANLSPEAAEITITAHAPSKTFNLAGLATSSVIISNPELRASYSQLIEKMHLGMGNLFGSVASTAAYLHGEPWRLQLIDYLNNNVEFTEKFIRKNIPALHMFRPEGTYMIWLDFTNFGLDDKTLNRKLIHEAGLGFNPGTDFGPGGEGFMRMNVACPRSTLTIALGQLERMLSG
ncbi:MAG: PatB family C-S lyase [Bacteroidetes bacterium]|nr:PatB family C-S lyase [Bacteroidota bacterium]